MEYFDVLNKWGEYTGDIASRDDVHHKGFWHKAVVIFIISNDKSVVLLQKRSPLKKLWPNMWDITAGGHVLKGEFGPDAALREAKEELGLIINKNDLEFIGATTSEVYKNDVIDKHYNEYYIIHKDVDIENTTLQQEEVCDIKWFKKSEIIAKIKNNYEGLTRKTGCWQYLIKYLEKDK